MLPHLRVWNANKVCASKQEKKWKKRKRKEKKKSNAERRSTEKWLHSLVRCSVCTRGIVTSFWTLRKRTFESSIFNAMQWWLLSVEPRERFFFFAIVITALFSFVPSHYSIPCCCCFRFSSLRFIEWASKRVLCIWRCLELDNII